MTRDLSGYFFVPHFSLPFFTLLFLFFPFPFFTSNMSRTFLPNTCDHMIYDGACECHERRVEGEDFWAALTEVLAEPTISIPAAEDLQVQEHLVDIEAEDRAEQERLAGYLADQEDHAADLEQEQEQVQEQAQEQAQEQTQELEDDYCDCCYNTPTYPQDSSWGEPEFERDYYNYDSDF